MSKTVPTTQPVVNIKRAAYAMATADGQSAEITMYGDIYEQQPTDWWGDPVEGQFITLTEFLEDLGQIAACKDITIRMNSYGGDAGVSNTIHNRLRELARGGAKLTCVVDGVAMSGGSLIMCACDTVKVNPSSLIMIHKCWGFFWGGYNADELREAAGQYDARRYRMVTGEVSKRDISYARSILEVERQGVKYKYDIPNDATTVALIAKHMGYAPNLAVTAYWDAEGADLYTPGGVYMFTCAPALLASKTYAEATPEGLRALGHHIQKGETYDTITEEFVEDVTRAKAMLSPNYEFNVQDSGTKEDYNALRERIMNGEYNRTLVKEQTKARKASERQERKLTKALEDAALARAKSKISDLSKYTK